MKSSSDAPAVPFDDQLPVGNVEENHQPRHPKLAFTFAWGTLALCNLFILLLIASTNLPAFFWFHCQIAPFIALLHHRIFIIYDCLLIGLATISVIAVFRHPENIYVAISGPFVIMLWYLSGFFLFVMLGV